jgi:hypothetical protein
MMLGPGGAALAGAGSCWWPLVGSVMREWLGTVGRMEADGMVEQKRGVSQRTTTRCVLDCTPEQRRSATQIDIRLHVYVSVARCLQRSRDFVPNLLDAEKISHHVVLVHVA